MRRTASSLVLRSILFVTLAAAAIAPHAAVAQRAGRPAAPRRWTVAPEVGAWWQDRSSREVKGGPGLLVGLRVARAFQPQMHFSAAAAFMRLEDSRRIEIGGGLDQPTRVEYYRAEMIPITLGIDWLGGFGPTTASVGVDGGALLWREPISHTTGPTYFGNESRDDWSRHVTLGGRLGVRHALGERVALQGMAGGFFGGSISRLVLTTTLGLAWQL